MTFTRTLQRGRCLKLGSSGWWMVCNHEPVLLIFFKYRYPARLQHFCWTTEPTDRQPDLLRTCWSRRWPTARLSSCSPPPSSPPAPPRLTGCLRRECHRSRGHLAWWTWAMAKKGHQKSIWIKQFDAWRKCTIFFFLKDLDGWACSCVRAWPTCPHLPCFLSLWGPRGRCPSGRTAAAPWWRRRSLGRAPRTRAAPMSACRSCSGWRAMVGNRRSSEGMTGWNELQN